jgi:hypothetical protein
MKFIKTIQNSFKFHTKNASEIVQQIMKGHCSQPFLRPSGENGPRPIYPRPPGPEAQQPTGGPPIRPVIGSRLGQNQACERPTATGRWSAWIAIRRSSARIGRTKTRGRPQPLENPSSIPFCSPSHPLAAPTDSGRRSAMAGDLPASARSGAAWHSHDQLSNSLLVFSSFFAFPSSLALQPQDPERSPRWRCLRGGGAGDGEGRRRPARGRASCSLPCLCSLPSIP